MTWSESFIWDDRTCPTTIITSVMRSFFNELARTTPRQATALDWAPRPSTSRAMTRSTARRRTGRCWTIPRLHRCRYNHVNRAPARTRNVRPHGRRAAATGLEYIDAWAERTQSNGGLIPSKAVGQPSVVAGTASLRLGILGHGHSLARAVAHRADARRTPLALANALLLTGSAIMISLAPGD
jgi:hypothetical protein